MSIPTRICQRVPNLVPIGASVWQLPRPLNLLPPTPPNAPWDIEGWLGFSRCPFPDKSADVNQSWCQSVQPFDSFPRILNVWPPNPPPPKCLLVSRGAICLAYIHSQMDLQMCATFGGNRSSRLTASPDFWICDTLTPPKCHIIEGRLVFSLCPFPNESADVSQSWCQSGSFPRLLNCWPPKIPQVPPFVSRGKLFGVYPFPCEFAHVCQIWCQSAQPFGSFSRICAKVSSAFRRCKRWLAQKHAKKQHLYI